MCLGEPQLRTQDKRYFVQYGKTFVTGIELDVGATFSLTEGFQFFDIRQTYSRDRNASISFKEAPNYDAKNEFQEFSVGYLAIDNVGGKIGQTFDVTAVDEIIKLELDRNLYSSDQQTVYRQHFAAQDSIGPDLLTVGSVNNPNIDLIGNAGLTRYFTGIRFGYGTSFEGIDAINTDLGNIYIEDKGTEIDFSSIKKIYNSGWVDVSTRETGPSGFVQGEILPQAFDQVIIGSQDDDVFRPGERRADIDGYIGDDTFLVAAGGFVSGNLRGGEGYDVLKVEPPVSSDPFASLKKNVNFLNTTFESIEKLIIPDDYSIYARGTVDFSSFSLRDGVRIYGGYYDYYHRPDSYNTTDNITGFKTADFISGAGKDDTIAGAGGDDTLFGGNGTDTVVYSGNRGDYDVQPLGQGRYRITDTRSGSPDGTDEVSQFEAFQFADGTFTNVNDLLNPPNNAPNASNDFATTTAGNSVTIDVLSNDSDANGDALSIDDVDTPLNGSVEIVDGELVYTPNGGFTGNEVFDYTITDGNGGSDTAQVKVTVNNDVGPIDPGTAQIGNQVWLDANGDGIRQDGEAGVGGVKVTLTGAGADGTFGTSDDISRTRTTTSGGWYDFKTLNAGDYKVTFSNLPAGLDFTTANVGTNEGRDSDANVTTGMTDVITLAVGEKNAKVDAGLVAQGTPAPENDIIGTNGADKLWGTAGADNIFGKDGNDTIGGGQGDDNLFGDGGNDKLFGGAGNDILSGSNQALEGVGEKDTMLGGGGADTFVLGSASHAYYSAQQWGDFAWISDFNASEDKVQLWGTPELYETKVVNGTTRLFCKAEAGKSSELIAYFANNTNVDITSSAFEYVSNNLYA